MLTNKTGPNKGNLLSHNKRLNTINKKLRLQLKEVEATSSKLKTDILFLRNEVSLLKQTGGKIENRRRMRPLKIQDYYNLAVNFERTSNMKFYKACKVLYEEYYKQINELIIKNSKSKYSIDPGFDDFYQNARTFKKRNQKNFGHQY